MFLLFLPLSFLIPSSSGLATVAMPIMAPLAVFASVPPELVVTAYQSASGIMNLFIPTSAVVMGGLAIARVPYGTYLQVGLAAAGDACGAEPGRAGSGSAARLRRGRLLWPDPAMTKRPAGPSGRVCLSRQEE